MKNYNSNISSLLGSLGGNNSINYSDYATIKSGSYKKLLKAYYNKDSKLNNTENSSKITDRIKVADSTDKSGVSKLNKSSDVLKNAAKAFEDKDLWKNAKESADYSKVSDKVKDFVKSYNDVVDASSKVDSKNVQNSARWMTGLTDVMKNSLSKVGITVDDKNKLSFDEDKFMKADANAVNALFADRGSFASQIADKASSIASAAINTSGIYGNDANVYNDFMSMFNQKF